MVRFPPAPCRRLGSLERRLRAVILHWLAAVAAIDEAGEAAGLDERELADLDEAGRKQLSIEVSKWDRLSAGVNLVLQRT